MKFPMLGFLSALILAATVLVSSNLKTQSTVIAQSSVPQVQIETPVKASAKDFEVKGTVSGQSGTVESILVSFSIMYDKSQTPVKTYTASVDPKTHHWVVQVKAGDLPDDVYSIHVDMKSSSGRSLAFSSVTVGSAVPGTAALSMK